MDNLIHFYGGIRLREYNRNAILYLESWGLER